MSLSRPKSLCFTQHPATRDGDRDKEKKQTFAPSAQGPKASGGSSSRSQHLGQLATGLSYTGTLLCPPPHCPRSSVSQVGIEVLRLTPSLLHAPARIWGPSPGVSFQKPISSGFKEGGRPTTRTLSRDQNGGCGTQENGKGRLSPPRAAGRSADLLAQRRRAHALCSLAAQQRAHAAAGGTAANLRSARVTWSSGSPSCPLATVLSTPSGTHVPSRKGRLWGLCATLPAPFLLGDAQSQGPERAVSRSFH